MTRREQIQELAARGLSRTMIAAELGIKRVQVARLMAKHGIEPARPPVRCKTLGKKHPSPLERARIVTDMARRHETGESALEVAARHGVHERTAVRLASQRSRA